MLRSVQRRLREPLLAGYGDRLLSELIVVQFRLLVLNLPQLYAQFVPYIGFKWGFPDVSHLRWYINLWIRPSYAHCLSYTHVVHRKVVLGKEFPTLKPILIVLTELDVQFTTSTNWVTNRLPYSCNVYQIPLNWIYYGHCDVNLFRKVEQTIVEQ